MHGAAVRPLPEPHTAGDPEQVMALSAAAAFLLCGLGVILLEGGLLTAVAAGLAAAAGAVALAAKVLNLRDKRRLRMCGDL